MDRDLVVKKLKNLTSAMLGELRIALPDSRGYVDDDGATVKRATQLINWAESEEGPGLDALVDEAARLFPKAFGEFRSPPPLVPAQPTSVLDPEDLIERISRSVSAQVFGQLRNDMAEMVRAGKPPECAVSEYQRQHPGEGLLQSLGKTDRIDFRVDAMFEQAGSYQIPASSGLEVAESGDGGGFESTSEHGLESMGTTPTPLSSVALPFLVRTRGDCPELAQVEGVTVLSRLGDVYVVRATREGIKSLGNHSKILSIDPDDEAGSWESALATMTFINAPLTMNNPPTDWGSGREAAIAFIDAGFDVLDPVLQLPPLPGQKYGASRFLAIWDMSAIETGGLPERFKPFGGVLHTQDDLNRYIRQGQVERGLRTIHPIAGHHGTAVAAIAGGTTDPGRFMGGISPESPLIGVIVGSAKYENQFRESIGYSTSHIAALDWIEATATAVNRPVVVNVSMGQSLGAHDGSSSLEHAFDAFSDNGRAVGRAIVKSAGNSREKKKHARVILGPNEKKRLPFDVPSKSSSVKMQCWFPNRSDLKINLVSPSKQSLSKPLLPDSTLTEPLAGAAVRIRYERMHRDNGASNISLVLTSSGADALNGRWTLEFETDQSSVEVEIHAWLEETPDQLSFADHIHEEMTLTIPGTAEHVICVSAVAVGETIEVGSFSCYGPTWNKQEKPEICAPGVDLQLPWFKEPAQGTSFAAPHVAGAIALAMSCCRENQLPLPNAVGLRSMLTRYAQKKGVIWNSGRGHGILDVKGFVEHVLEWARTQASENLV